MDIIFIESFRVETLIGIYPRERIVPQPVVLDLKIGRTTLTAGTTDDIQDTIDYARVVSRLREVLGSQHFLLLEKLAEFVATLLIEEFGAQWVQVSVAKLGMMPQVARVGVVIERSAK